MSNATPKTDAALAGLLDDLATALDAVEDFDAAIRETVGARTKALIETTEKVRRLNVVEMPAKPARKAG